MRRRLPPLLALLALALAAAWLLWPRPSPAPTPPAPLPAPARGGPLDALRAPGGALAPTARLVPAAPGPRAPCVRGRVLSAATSAGVPGARVALASEAGVLTAVAGAGGAFELEAPAGHLAVAEVTAPGFLPFRPAWGHSPVELTLVPGVCVSELVLSLTPERAYRGLVLGPGESPVGEASVTVATPEEGPGPAITSGPDGTFGFSAPPGAVVVARKSGFAPAAAAVDFRVEVTRRLVLRLGALAGDAGPGAVPLTGLVVDGADAGVPGARVTARQALGEAGERLEGWTESDAEGRFALAAGGPGPWTLEARAAGVGSEAVATRGEPVRLVLRAGAELEGTVADGAGRAVQSFTVLLARRLGPLQVDREDVWHRVDPAGRFHLRGLPPGPGRLVVAAVGYAPSAPQDLELAPGRPATVAVTLREGGAVAGRVVDRADGGPLPGAQVSLEGGPEASAVAVTPVAHADGDGGFLLTGVGPGPHSLFASAEGHHARLLTVPVRESETAGPLTVDLAPLDPGEEPRVELVGIGAVLQARGDALVLVQVVEGGGAAEAGLVPGDGILAIDGVAAVRLGFAGGVERIRGPEGTVVQLQVRRGRDGAVLEVPTPRRRLVR